MNAHLLKYFKRFNFLSLEDIKLISSMLSIRKVSVGEQVVREGEVFYFAIFILRGLLRNYITTSNGEQRTVFLAYEGMQNGCPESIFQDRPATATIEALEPSLLVLLDTRKLDKLAKNKAALLRFKISSMENSFMDIVNRVKFLTDLTPEERYLHLRDNHPKLIQRVPQIYLASYTTDDILLL